MNNKVTNAIMFALGAAIGSAVTWKLTSMKYEAIVQEEIDSIRETFANRKETIFLDETEPLTSETEASTEKEGSQYTKEKPNLFEYAKLLKEEGYTSYSGMSDNKSAEEKGGGESVDPVIFAPYVISPDEYGDFDHYDTTELTYYDDGVLVDDFDNVIEDIDDLIGMESLDHFGEYQEDVVHVRNDEKETDYEITKDPRTYHAVIQERPPHWVDD